MYLIWIAAFAGLAFLAYVRLAPSDEDIWHVVPKVSDDKTFGNGVTRRVVVGKDGLRRMDALIGSDPRTQQFAGSLEEGMITYISRSRMMGYPDYTTMMQSGEDLLIYARSRFGRKDFGVNAARVDRWIATLTAY
ncbi:Protein of unknown function [Shimia gijangensis]|uniref:DUF1499 domain-containing protein n=1 Tax=Shimia gijangensis TaxID=1470563 RepID=A0A1M6HE67_9RHOB|nr:DUF1499 domain-containing protein [Shimia gijangensis]SHJ20491.1 Protein of unknown function [Shimia gijangensis]